MSILPLLCRHIVHPACGGQAGVLQCCALSAVFVSGNYKLLSGSQTEQFRFLKPLRPEALKPKSAPSLKSKLADIHVNSKIQASSLRVVFPDGSNAVHSIHEALALARQLDLDLVEVAPTANPPVAKLIKFAEYKKDVKLAEEQLVKKTRQQAKQVEAKEMHFSTKIADHDLETKLRKTRDLLESERRVSIIVEYKTPENKEAGNAALAYIVSRLEDVAAPLSKKVIDRGRELQQTLQPIPTSGNG